MSYRARSRCAGWLIAHRPFPQSARVSAADLALAVGFRDALRTLLDRDTADPQAAKALHELARELPLTVDFAGSEPTLVHEGTAARGFLADVLAGCVAAGLQGRWSRLKMCAAPDLPMGVSRRLAKRAWPLVQHERLRQPNQNTQLPRTQTRHLTPPPRRPYPANDASPPSFTAPT